MNVRVVNPISVIYFSEKLTLKDLMKYVRVKAQELYKDAISHSLEITGPVYWLYYGMDGKPDTVFTLEIAIPITLTHEYKGKFGIKSLNIFKHLSKIHYGEWTALPETYKEIFIETTGKGYVPSGIYREVYQHNDFEIPSNNITEVQVGVL